MCLAYTDDICFPPLGGNYDCGFCIASNKIGKVSLHIHCLFDWKTQRESHQQFQHFILFMFLGQSHWQPLSKFLLPLTILWIVFLQKIYLSHHHTLQFFISHKKSHQESPSKLTLSFSLLDYIQTVKFWSSKVFI